MPILAASRRLALSWRCLSVSGASYNVCMLLCNVCADVTWRSLAVILIEASIEAQEKYKHQICAHCIKRQKSVGFWRFIKCTHIWCLYFSYASIDASIRMTARGHQVT